MARAPVRTKVPASARWRGQRLGMTAAAIVAFSVLAGCTVKLSIPLPVCETLTVAAPAGIRTAALSEADRYLNMEYELGGDDHWSLKGIDCSGLVVNAYAAATNDGEYWMPFDDATSTQMHGQFSEAVTVPEPGDLAFMGDVAVDHVAIVEKFDGSSFTVIEASSVSGVVSRARYSVSYSRLIEFGRLRIRTKRCAGDE